MHICACRIKLLLHLFLAELASNEAKQIDTAMIKVSMCQSLCKQCKHSKNPLAQPARVLATIYQQVTTTIIIVAMGSYNHMVNRKLDGLSSIVHCLGDVFFCPGLVRHE